jgi:pimeloyl-ACP methyl ester carboxylesterase
MIITSLPHLDGITSRTIETPRGRVHLLQAGATDGRPMLFIHGNAASSTWWEEVMLALPSGYLALAPDLRGYGASECQPVDATRGMQDFSDDLHSLVETLGLRSFDLVGHSMGGVVAMHYTTDHPARVVSLTLVATGSPYGFGGTRDLDGTPCWPDYAGSGGGLINPEYFRLLQAGDRSDTSDFSPRRLLRRLCAGAPSVRMPREDALVEAILCMATSEGNYSRDMRPSPNWPHVAPGTSGVNNALSPKYCNLRRFADCTPKPPVFWVRGDRDPIVSDRSITDPGNLGAMGVLPGWPGPVIYPPQPMVGQVRAVLQRYQASGGAFEEQVIPNVGHVPYLEDLPTFMRLWLPFVQVERD